MSICSALGASTFIYFGKISTFVSNELIESFYAKEIGEGIQDRSVLRFKIDDAVEVVGGPMITLSAIFDRIVSGE